MDFFYEQLDAEGKFTPRQDVLIIMDLNAKVGKDNKATTREQRASKTEYPNVPRPAERQSPSSMSWAFLWVCAWWDKPGTTPGGIRTRGKS